MKLYEIEQAYYDWQQSVLESDGEITDELLDQLEAVTQNCNDKLEAYACLIKSVQSDAEAIKAEKQRLAGRQERADNLADKLKERLTYAMRFFDKEKFSTPKCAISFRRSQSVNIIDAGAVPTPFVEIQVKILKSKISEALKSGAVVPGCELVEKQNIQIK